MKHILHISVGFIIVTGILSCSEADKTDVQGQEDIVIVGGDTLGRNWDNLPTKEEAEQARELGLTPEQFMQLKDEQQKEFLEQKQREDEGSLGQGDDANNPFTLPSTTFSDQMYKEPNYSVETVDGREVVVGSGNAPPQ